MIKIITKNLFLVLFASVLGFQVQAQGMKERAANDHFDKRKSLGFEDIQFYLPIFDGRCQTSWSDGVKYMA